FCGAATLFDERCDRLRFFDDVEVLPVDVFGDRCRDECDAVPGDFVVDDDVEIGAAELVCGRQPPASVDDDEAGGDAVLGIQLQVCALGDHNHGLQLHVGDR